MSQKPYFTFSEVVLHNTAESLWVVLFGKVLNLTPLCEIHKDDPGISTLLTFGGKDISHFFDPYQEIKYHVDPETGRIDTFLPFTPLFGAPKQAESEKLYIDRKKYGEQLAESVIKRFNSQRLREDDTDFCGEVVKMETPKLQKESVPWWKDEQYVIGELTSKSRWINIRNMLINKTVRMEVCSEDTIDRILERYIRFNTHANGYTWKFLGEELVMGETLHTNGLPDLDEKTNRLRMDNEEYYPTVDLYFNDDHIEI